MTMNGALRLMIFFQVLCLVVITWYVSRKRGGNDGSGD